MVERLRPASGDNVTDQTRIEALGECTATFAEQEEAADVAKTAKSNHSNMLKKWKQRGIRINSLKRAIKDRMLDPDEVLRDEHEYCRLRALQNMPSIQQDLMAMWAPMDVSDDQAAEIARQRWRDDGSFSARQGAPRENNPHAVGSEAHQTWDMGWSEDQERIAKAMGAGDAPVVDAGRVRRGRRRVAENGEANAVH